MMPNSNRPWCPSSCSATAGPRPRRQENAWVRWYRDAHYYPGGDILIWEYPRQTPDGNQVDILELMQHRDGQIYRHRIYWGWFGSQMLIHSALAKQNQAHT